MVQDSLYQPMVAVLITGGVRGWSGRSIHHVNDVNVYLCNPDTK